MIGIKKFKLMFFDRQAVISQTDRAARSALSKAGAFIRRSAKGLIRNRKRSARPGQPPSNRTGLLKRFIFFGWDSSSRSVVVGPAKLNQRSPYGPVTIPEVLEEGGTVSTLHRSKRVTRRYQGNPYMGPAYKENEAKIPELWRNSVK